VNFVWVPFIFLLFSKRCVSYKWKVYFLVLYTTSYFLNSVSVFIRLKKLITAPFRSLTCELFEKSSSLLWALRKRT
jgi:hypothetical protein